MSKAFDSLNHDILLKKLYCYGIRGVNLLWFKNYLVNRQQFVSIDNVNSKLLTSKCGVPQGSILGPLLFSIYVNDMCNISELLNFIMFADDTSVFMSHRDLNILEREFNQELKKLVHWLQINKLVLNINKTHYMVFTNVHWDTSNFVIKIQETEIERVNRLKFLGVTIDEKISWNEHIGCICNTLSKNIGILNKLKFFPQDILLMLYHFLVSPYLNYCILMWANSTTKNVDRVFKLQKRAIRIITHSKYLAHTTPLFARLKIFNIYDMYKFQSAIFMYMCSHKVLPASIMSYFNVNSSIHNYFTRSNRNYNIPCARTTLFQKSILYNGPKIWNEIPNHIKTSLSLNIFKKKYKLYLFQTNYVQ